MTQRKGRDTARTEPTRRVPLRARAAKRKNRRAPNRHGDRSAPAPCPSHRPHGGPNHGGGERSRGPLRSAAAAAHEAGRIRSVPTTQVPSHGSGSLQIPGDDGQSVASLGHQAGHRPADAPGASEHGAHPVHLGPGGGCKGLPFLRPRSNPHKPKRRPHSQTAAGRAKTP